MQVEEKAGARRAPPQDVDAKIAIIRRHFPTIDAMELAGRLISIDEAKDGRILLHFQEDDRLDVDAREGLVRQFGLGARAKAFGQVIAGSLRVAFSQHADDEWGRAKDASKPIRLAPLTRQECQAIAEKWKDSDLNEISLSKNGVIVQINATSWLVDRGNEAMLHGATSDEAIRVLMMKAQRDWNNRIELIGTDEYKARAWKIAQEEGVTVVGYMPPGEPINGGKRPQTEPKQPAKASMGETSDNVELHKTNIDDEKKIEIRPNAVEKESSEATMTSEVVSAENDDDWNAQHFEDDSPTI